MNLSNNGESIIHFIGPSFSSKCVEHGIVEKYTREAGVGIGTGVREQRGRQDSLAFARASCALPRGRCLLATDCCAISRLLCCGGAHEQAQCTPTTKQPATCVVGCEQAERTRFELAVELPLRQFSKLLVSATHPPLRKLAEKLFSIASAKVLLFLIPARVLLIFFQKNVLRNVR